ncbi:hypothetical protein HX001_05305 [Empedobacter brevis]|uniref:Uncharacterized protein n=1 Tax=Empedobacter brevis TaxID=247 RepID=A0AAJ1QD76_9FLAO|nr:DUF6452 family protein [Empedobacter brevis]MDM1071913.1 hypothetical protein [Empedobacter brevis]QHC86124.1 hypothetical protein AS589_15685 [Empedobacter brevis]
MKKIQNFLTYSIFVSIIAFSFYSCEDDDICTDEGEVPRMVADMYYTIDKTTKLEDTIFYWAYVLKDSNLTGTSEDTILIDQGSVNMKSTFAAPVRQNKKKEIYYTIAQGKDRAIKDPATGQDTVIRAKRDRLILTYDTIGNAYTSKACGFGLTFKGANVKLVTKTANSSGNWIKNIETVNTEIKDGSTTIIKLFADERN